MLALRASTRIAPQLLAPAGSRGMAVSAKSIKLRLKTVSNIRRITSTMKMVAASKLRGFQSRMEAARPLADAVNRTFDSVPAGDDAPAQDAAAAVAAHGDAAAAAAPAAGSNLPLFLCVSSDRGLCGGINGNVIKVMRRQSAALKNEVQIVAVGDKARTALSRSHSKMLRFSVNDVFKKPPTFITASLLAEEVSGLPYSACTLVYNKFKNAAAFEITEETVQGVDAQLAALPRVGQVFEFEGDDRLIMSDLIQFRFAVSIFRALLENATCEQAARVSAMDGASKNCGEMINKLTTQMNRARQSAITTELCEIVAGAEAIAA